MDSPNMAPQKTSRQLLTSNLKFLFVAGGGLFGDGYLNTTIGLVVPMIGYIYFQNNKGKVPTTMGSTMKSTFSIGMIVGQLAFGLLGDTLGRRRVYGKECLFAIFGTLLVVLLPWKGLSHTGVVTWISVFRVLSGIGAGGDYPMTPTLAAEHPIFGTRARLICFTFGFIVLGQLAAAIVFLVLLAAFKSSIEEDITKLEYVWRLLLGLGIIPATVTLYARFKMRETEPYQKYVAKEAGPAVPARRNIQDQMTDFVQYFGQWKHAKVLVATCMCWFLFDIAFYGVSLNQSIVLTGIGFGKGPMPFDTLWNTAIGNIITVFAGSLPGVALGIWLPDLIGRRTQQFWWSLGTALMYAVWAGVTNIASTGALVALFTLSQLVIASGPNITTFLIPVEVFPTRVRGSAHGLSAAAGKAGALITSFAFGSAVDNIGMNGVLGLFTGIMVLTAIFTLWIPEAKGYSLEDIENDVMYGKRPYDVEETESSDICKTDTLVAGNALAKDVKESNTVTEVGKAA